MERVTESAMNASKSTIPKSTSESTEVLTLAEWCMRTGTHIHKARRMAARGEIEGCKRHHIPEKPGCRGRYYHLITIRRGGRPTETGAGFTNEGEEVP